MGKPSKIEALPDAARRWLEQALLGKNFSGYQELESLLKQQGYTIGKSSIHRYGKQMERRMAAIRASTEAARMITEGAADDQDARSEAVIAMVQTELFEAILNLQEAEEADPTERLGVLSAAAKNIATLTRASVNQKKFRHDVEARVKAAAEKVGKLAERGGLPVESVVEIRNFVLGIAT